MVVMIARHFLERGIFKLVRFLKQGSRKPHSKEKGAEGDESLDATPACPECGGGMTKRTARRGANVGSQFWGCRSFPSCQGTRKAA